MCNSGVLPEHRGTGIYSMLCDQIVEDAFNLGYDQIWSQHAPSNKEILIAKLKKDFVINGFEITDRYGTLVSLTRFKNQKRKDLFDYRTGYRALGTDLSKVINK